MDWSTGIVYIKTAPLILYICLKYVSEIHIITERMNQKWVLKHLNGSYASK